MAASRAPYLLFLDGDCILPPDHVAVHLLRRRPGVVMAGHFARLDEPTSARIDDRGHVRGEFCEPGFGRRTPAVTVQGLDRKSRLYNGCGHPTKPKLFGNNIGIWRTDYERVNGYDENFEGWGCEDDDLRLRLRRRRRAH